MSAALGLGFEVGPVKLSEFIKVEKNVLKLESDPRLECFPFPDIDTKCTSENKCKVSVRFKASNKISIKVAFSGLMLAKRLLASNYSIYKKSTKNGF